MIVGGRVVVYHGQKLDTDTNIKEISHSFLLDYQKGLHLPGRHIEKSWDKWKDCSTLGSTLQKKHVHTEDDSKKREFPS